jgi:hypothetical protein
MPHLVTAQDIEAADLTINIGCDLSEFQTTKAVIMWSAPQQVSTCPAP